MGQSAIITSPIVKIEKNNPLTRFSMDYCVMFWSFISQRDAKLTVMVNLYSEKIFKQMVLSTLANVSESNWTPHYVTLSNDVLKEFNEFSILFDSQIVDPNTIVAIDDIDLSRTECQIKSQFDCGQKHYVDISKVCDFHKDCPNGEDEVNCGNCSFETGKLEFSLLFE